MSLIKRSTDRANKKKVQGAPSEAKMVAIARSIVEKYKDMPENRPNLRFAREMRDMKKEVKKAGFAYTGANESGNDRIRLARKFLNKIKGSATRDMSKVWGGVDD